MSGGSLLMGRMFHGVAAVLVLLVTARSGMGSVVPVMTFEQVVTQAQLIFVGTVVRTESEWRTTPEGRAIVTVVTFRVERLHKGASQGEISLEFLGGRVGDVSLEVSGVPRFNVGQEDVICAVTAGPQVSPIAGFNQGRFRINRDVTTGRRYVTTHDGLVITGVQALGRRELTAKSPSEGMTLEQFEQAISQAMRSTSR